jgi:hypothetical protein
LQFGTTIIYPSSGASVGNATDGVVDLGGSATRFKDLHLSGNVNATNTYLGSGNELGWGGTYSQGKPTISGSAGGINFYGAGITSGLSATITSGGNLLVGGTNTAPGVSNTEQGVAIRGSGDHRSFFSVSGNYVAAFNRNTNDGSIVEFNKDGVGVGAISTYGSGLVVGNANSSAYANIRFTNNEVFPCTTTGGNNDDAIDLGKNNSRYRDIYAGNGTINTSDRNEKQDIEELSDAEQRVAVACKGLLRKFRWINSVADKGDDARIHFGIIAQDLQDAFTAEGLDAGRYGMFINSTWTDEETGEERSRMGVRYSELLAFIIAAI